MHSLTDFRNHSQQINVKSGENRKAAYLQKNPQGTVPALELADGRVCGESVMICQYLDEIYGPTTLMGLTAEDRLETKMWLSRIDENILNSMGEGVAVIYVFGLPLSLSFVQTHVWP